MQILPVMRKKWENARGPQRLEMIKKKGPEKGSRQASGSFHRETVWFFIWIREHSRGKEF